MTVGNNPATDRSKLGTKRHILTDKKGIPISVVITSANTHDIKAVTEVIDNTVIKRTTLSSRSKGKKEEKEENSINIYVLIKLITLNQ